MMINFVSDLNMDILWYIVTGHYSRGVVVLDQLKNKLYMEL